MARRISVVTGAAKGIGRAIAQALVAEGDLVVGLDVDGPGLVKLAEDLGDTFQGIVADVGEVAEINRTLDQVIAQHGRLDVMVNNAGVSRRAPLQDLTEEDWDRITRVNAKGVFFCLQRAAKQMTEQGNGRIINIASVAGKGYHGSSNAIYVGTKGAVIAMTRYAAWHLGPQGVTVNAVCPGVTHTEIFQGIIEKDAENQGISVDQVLEKVLSTVPVRRGNTTDEVAAMVVYLASDAARNVTGQAFNIDGGLVMD